MINTEISDLFFNTDMSQAVIYDKNRRFERYNTEKLLDIASDFLSNISSITNIELPNNQELVNDFFARL